MTGRALRQTGHLIGGAALSKALGFVREVEMARVLGAGVVADGFRAAMTATMLPVVPVIGEALAVGVIPLHRVWREQGRAPECCAALVVLFLGVFTGVAAGVWWLAEPWTRLLVGGFGPEAAALTARLVRVLALGIPGLVLAVLLGAVEIALGRSRITVLRGSLQNVGILLGLVSFALHADPAWLAWGFVVANTLVAAYGFVSLWRAGEIAPGALRPRLVARVGAEVVRPIRPLLVIPFAEQGHLLVERALASAAVVGTLASLEYARTLTESAFFLFGQPIGYVILAGAGGAPEDLRARVLLIARATLALAVPVSVVLAVFAPDIVRLVFQRGAFQEQAVAQTAGALGGIALGLWAMTLGFVLIRLLNATGRNRTAALVIVSAYAVNASVNLAVVPTLGSFGLGLGEAARGVTVLVAAAVALGCGGLLWRQIAPLLPIAAALALVGIWICASFDTSLARLSAGVAAGAVAVLLSFWVVMPREMRRVARRFGRGRRGAVAALDAASARNE